MLGVSAPPQPGLGLGGGGGAFMPRGPAASGMFRPNPAAPTAGAAPVAAGPTSALDPAPAAHPHSDPNLSFDFEPTLERISASKVIPRVADPKFKTVVCIHWYNGLCMKGDKCEFLHEMDLDRMPECRLGERCTDKMCPFKHVKAEDKALCNNYIVGFCPHGATCRYQHKKRPPEQLPEVCEYAKINIVPKQFTAAPGAGGADGTAGDGSLSTNPHLSKAQNLRRQLNYRTALCHSFSQFGTCSYGDNCDYAHSEEEMRRNIALRNQAMPSKLSQFQQPGPGGVPVKRVLASALDQLALSLRDWRDSDEIDPAYMTPLTLPPPVERLPDAGQESPRYFVVRSSNIEVLARSAMHDRWIADPSLAPILNNAFAESSAVFLFFAVDSDERIFGGVARMQAAFEVVPNNDPKRCSNPPPDILPVYAEGQVQWMRINELSFKKTAYLMAVNPLVQRELPVAHAFDGQELPPSIGHALMTMCYREEPLQLGDADLDFALEVHPPGPSAEVEAALAEVPPIPQEPAVQVKSDGFILQISSPQVLMESMGRMMFGMALSDATAALETIQVGTIVLAYTPFDGKLHGVFEAISGLERNWESKAFLSSPTATTSSLPMQFRFRLLAACDPIHENALSTAFKQRPGVYHQDELQPIVNIFVTRTRRGEVQPPLRSPAIEAVEKGMPAPLVVSKGISWSEPSQSNQVWKQSCMVNIEFNPNFKAPNRLIGKNGQNMQMIKERSGALRARVFAGHEAPAEGVMEMVFEAPTSESLEEARRLGQEQLDDLLRQWEEYKQRGIQMRMQREGLLPPGPLPGPGEDNEPPQQPNGPGTMQSNSHQMPGGFQEEQFPPQQFMPPQQFAPPRGAFPPRGQFQQQQQGPGFFPRGPGRGFPPRGPRGPMPPQQQFQQGPPFPQQPQGQQFPFPPRGPRGGAPQQQGPPSVPTPQSPPTQRQQPPQVPVQQQNRAQSPDASDQSGAAPSDRNVSDERKEERRGDRKRNRSASRRRSNSPSNRRGRKDSSERGQRGDRDRKRDRSRTRRGGGGGGGDKRRRG